MSWCAARCYHVTRRLFAPSFVDDAYIARALQASGPVRTRPPQVVRRTWLRSARTWFEHSTRGTSNERLATRSDRFFLPFLTGLRVLPHGTRLSIYRPEKHAYVDTLPEKGVVCWFKHPPPFARLRKLWLFSRSNTARWHARDFFRALRWWLIARSRALSLEGPRWNSDCRCAGASSRSHLHRTPGEASQEFNQNLTRIPFQRLESTRVKLQCLFCRNNDARCGLWRHSPLSRRGPLHECFDHLPTMSPCPRPPTLRSPIIVLTLSSPVTFVSHFDIKFSCIPPLLVSSAFAIWLQRANGLCVMHFAFRGLPLDGKRNRNIASFSSFGESNYFRKSQFSSFFLLLRSLCSNLFKLVCFRRSWFSLSSFRTRASDEDAVVMLRESDFLFKIFAGRFQVHRLCGDWLLHLFSLS